MPDLAFFWLLWRGKRGRRPHEPAWKKRRKREGKSEKKPEKTGKKRKKRRKDRGRRKIYWQWRWQNPPRPLAHKIKLQQTPHHPSHHRRPRSFLLLSSWWPTSGWGAQAHHNNGLPTHTCPHTRCMGLFANTLKSWWTCRTLHHPWENDNKTARSTEARDI